MFSVASSGAKCARTVSLFYLFKNTGVEITNKNPAAELQKEESSWKDTERLMIFSTKNCGTEVY